MTLRPVFKCHGGKRYLIDFILSAFPKGYENLRYIEGCCGGCSVTLNKKPSVSETVNDADPSVIGIIRQVVNNSESFIQAVNKLEYTEENFEWSKIASENSDGMERSVAELVRRRFSRGGLREAFSWSDRLRGGRPGDVNSWETFKEQLPVIADRLKRVKVYCMPILELVTNLDAEDALFYCLTPETPIRLHNEEIKRIDQIQKDDILYGDRKVLKVLKMPYKGNILEIKIQGSSNLLRITSDHRIIRIPRHYNRHEKRTNDELWNLRELVPANQLQEKDYVLIPIGGYDNQISWYWNNENVRNGRRRKDVVFSPSQSLFRLLGYYAAEGHIERCKGKPVGITLSFNSNELNTFIKDVQICLKENFNVEGTIRHGPAPTNKDSVRQVNLCSVSIAEFVDRYVKGVAKTKVLHPDLMILKPKEQIELLIGWIRGDGGLYSQSRNRTKLTGTSSSYVLAQQMYTIALRCGLRPLWKKRRNNYDVYFSSKDAEELGFQVRAKRFSNTRRIINGYILTRIRNINIVPYEGLVYDLDVDKDNLFIASNILVSNCDPPYVPKTRQSPRIYAVEMTEKDHIELAEALNRIKGKAVLSGYQSPLYNKLYKSWNMYFKEMANHSSQAKIKERRLESLWTNF